MTLTTAPVTVTLELSFDDAFALKSALVDSSCYWHKLWQETIAGNRPDLSSEGCLLIQKRAQRLYDFIEQSGVVA